MAFQELYRGRQRIRTGNTRWYGYVTGECPNAEAEGIETSKWHSNFPGMSGIEAPIAARITSNRNWKPGITKITIHYATPRALAMPPVGAAYIYIASQMKTRRKLKDLDGKIIEGPDDTGKGWYAVTSGTNIDIESRALLRVAFAYQNYNYHVDEERHNKINGGYLPNLGAARATLLFIKTAVRHKIEPGDPYYVDRYFLREPAGWNSLKSQEGDKVARKIKVNDEAGVVVEGAYRTVLVWKPKDGSAPQDRRIKNEADFSDWDAMIHL